MYRLWTTLLGWLAVFLPGWKTQLTVWGGLIAPGTILAILEYLQNTDLSSNIPAQYYPIYMALIGILVSIFRAAAGQPKVAKSAKGVQ